MDISTITRFYYARIATRLTAIEDSITIKLITIGTNCNHIDCNQKLDCNKNAPIQKETQSKPNKEIFLHIKELVLIDIYTPSFGIWFIIAFFVNVL